MVIESGALRNPRPESGRVDLAARLGYTPDSMLRHPFAGHRRYSITHRAVQRLRELVPGGGSSDDEALRDQLDSALAASEDDGKAIRTLDAMLGEPQTLIPVAEFGEVLYAIIKEETVVTVLPRGHGEEILQRGQAMEQRVASGAAVPRERAGSGEGARRWRPREAEQPVVVQRIVRGAAPGGGIVSRIEPVGSMAPDEEAQTVSTDAGADLAGDHAKVVTLEERPDGPLEKTLRGALDRARRRAAVSAIREVLQDEHRETPVLRLWDELVRCGVPRVLTLGDLIEAARVR